MKAKGKSYIKVKWRPGISWAKWMRERIASGEYIKCACNNQAVTCDSSGPVCERCKGLEEQSSHELQGNISKYQDR